MNFKYFFIKFFVGGNMTKILLVIAVKLVCISDLTKNLEISFNKELLTSYSVPAATFSYEKYNQQNTALRKIKINNYQPDMDNTVILILDGTDIDFIINDLRKDGFDVNAYTDGHGYYFIAVDFSGNDEYYIADSSVGLAKYYYVKEVLVSKKIFDEIFGLKNKKNFKKSYTTKIGIITGSINNLPADITINKIEWTIKGGVNSYPINIEIDHDTKKIKGLLGNSYVNLNFDWSIESVKVFGKIDNGQVNYYIDWKEGILSGLLNEKQINLRFNMYEDIVGANKVKINGNIGYYNTELIFDKVSGKLNGNIGYYNIDIKLVNCDLYDFLQYIFVFYN